MKTAQEDSPRARTFLRALGGELRKARIRRGWTRKQLLLRLPFAASLQTIATWELATRHINVGRFLELTDTLGVNMLDVLTPALAKITEESESAMSVDLVLIARTDIDQLGPLSRWARERLAADPYRRPNVVTIRPTALTWLAVLCEVDTDELTRLLQTFTR